MSANQEVLLPPRPERGGVLGLGPPQLGIVAVSAPVALIALANGAYLWALGTIALAAVMVLPVQHIPGHSWIPIFVRNVRLLVKGGITWRSRAHLEGYFLHRDTVPKELFREFGGRYELAEFPYRGGGLGVLHNRDEESCAIMLKARAGSFLIMDPSGQLQFNRQFGECLDQLATSEQPVSRLQWTLRTTPADTAEHELYQEQNYSFDQSDPIARQYVEAVNQTVARGSRHDIEFVLALKPSLLRAVKQTARRQGGGLKAQFEALTPHFESLVSSLVDMGIKPIRGLTATEYSYQLRRALNPTGSRDVNLDELAGEYESPWPSYIHETPGQVTIDGTHFSTFWVVGYSHRALNPDFMAKVLNAAGVMRTISVIAEPVPAAKAERSARMGLVTKEAWADNARDKGRREKLSARRDRDWLRRREEEIDAGYSGWRYICYVTVAAMSEDELQQDVRRVKNLARSSKLTLRPLYGWQLAGVTYTAPMARGLD